MTTDAFRASPGDPIPTDADAFSTLAEMGRKYAQDKYAGTPSPGKQLFGQGNWIARVVNATGMELPAGSVVQVGPYPWGSGAYPTAWMAKNNWGEVNEQPLMLGAAPTTAGRMHAVLLEKCRVGGTAEACVGGYCFARVEFLGPVGGGGITDPATTSEWADIIPGQTGRLKMGGAGAFRVVEIFYGRGDDQTNPANNAPISPCLVELQRPGALPPVYRCFGGAQRTIANGQQRLFGSVYLPPVAGVYLLVAEVEGTLNAGGADEVVSADFTVTYPTWDFSQVTKRIDFLGQSYRTTRTFGDSLSWIVDSVIVPSGSFGTSGLQADLTVQCVGSSPSASATVTVRRFYAVRLGTAVSSCSRLPPEPPVFLGPFQRYAYTPDVPFEFIITVSDEATPPGSIAVTVDAGNPSVGTVSVATVAGQPAQRLVTLTVPTVGAPTIDQVRLRATDSDGEYALGDYFVHKQGTVAPTFAQSPIPNFVALGPGESATVSWTVTDADNTSGPFTFGTRTPRLFPSPANTYSTASYATITLTPDDPSSWRTGTATITCTAGSPIGDVVTGWSFTVTDPNSNVITTGIDFVLKGA